MKRVTVVFEKDDGILFTYKMEGQVHESQFEIMGREFIALAKLLREHRLAQQTKVRTEIKVESAQAASGDGSSSLASGPKE